jgi:hypothetical protein
MSQQVWQDKEKTLPCSKTISAEQWPKFYSLVTSSYTSIEKKLAFEVGITGLSDTTLETEVTCRSRCWYVNEPSLLKVMVVKHKSNLS